MCTFLKALAASFKEGTLRLRTLNLWIFQSWDVELLKLLIDTLSLSKSTVKAINLDFPRREASFTLLTSLVRECRLQRLTLGCITLAIVDTLGSALSKNSSVQFLSFSCYEYRGRDTAPNLIQFFRNLRSNDSLEELEVRRWELQTIPTTDFLSYARHIPSLKLYLRPHDRFQPERLIPIMDSYKNLKSLSLRGWRMLNAGVQMIANFLRKHDVLEELDLRNCLPGSIGLLVLGNALIRNKGLMVLKLNNGGAPRVNKKFLRCLALNKSLTFLDLGRFELEHDGGIHAFANLLAKHKRLKELNLKLSKWSKATNHILVRSLTRNSSLVSLRLGYPTLEDENDINVNDSKGRELTLEQSAAAMESILVDALRTTNVVQFEFGLHTRRVSWGG